MDIKKKIVNTIKELLKFHRENIKKFRNKRIYLGRMFSLGNMFQYLLAKNLFKNTKYEILVDCAISIKDRKSPLYPDILLIENKKNNKKLKGIIDVKIDCGWINTSYFGFEVLKESKREKNYKYTRKENKFLKEYKKFLNTKEFSYKIRNEYNEVEKNKRYIVKIPVRVFKIVIILMENVNHHRRIEGYKFAVKDAGFSFLSILTDVNIRKPRCGKLAIEEIDKNDKITKILKCIYK